MHKREEPSSAPHRRPKSKTSRGRAEGNADIEDGEINERCLRPEEVSGARYRQVCADGEREADTVGVVCGRADTAVI
jgi:hypothetical protein